MFNWRTTLIVSIVIPLALLFSFICLHLMGMSANLLSLGAVDFGIIIDGAVVMVEGLFVVLDEMPRTPSSKIRVGVVRDLLAAEASKVGNAGARKSEARA